MIKRFTFLIAFVAMLSTQLFAQNQFRASIQTKNYTQPFQVCKDEPVVLEAFPKSDTLTYDWYRNGQFLFSSKNEKLTLNEGGFYKVTVKSKNYQSESEEIQIEQCRPAIPIADKKVASTGVLAVYPTISSANPVICGSNTTAILQANPVNAAFTYQWSFSTTQYGTYTNISGATNNSYTTTAIGYYKVAVNDGTGANTSSGFSVSNTPQAFLTDMAGNLYTDVNLSGGNAQLKVTMYGGAPYTFEYYDGSIYKTILTSTSPYILTVSPNQNRRYSPYSVSNSCGVNYTTYGSNRVIIDINTSATLNSPSSLNVCAGSTISLPFTTVGTWQTEKKLEINLYDAVTNNYISGGFKSGLTQNPIEYTLPATLPIGTYKVSLSGSLPNFYSNLSTYILNVNATGCNPTATFTGSNVACSSTFLSANPCCESSGYLYQWYKDGVAIGSATSNLYSVTQTGNYKVNVSKASIGLNSTSTESLVSISGFVPTITATNPVLCGSNSSVTLNTTITTGTYQWYKTIQNGTSGLMNTPIAGATGSSYTTTVPGSYLVKIDNGTCVYTSNSFSVTTTPTTNLTNTSGNSNPIDISAGGTATLQVAMTGIGPWNFYISDGVSNKYYTANSSPFTINVSPDQTRRYVIYGFESTCGAGNAYGSLTVNVLPTPSFTLNTPALTTVCAGSTIDIPYSIAGNWGSDRKLSVELSTAAGAYVSNSYIGGFSTNPMPYQVPSSIPVGTYNVKVYSDLPYLLNGVVSSYSINVTNTGCTAPVATILGSNTICNTFSNTLIAYPRGTGYTFQWYLDGVAISGATGNFHTVTTAGNYTVNVINTGTGYNSTSGIKTISGIGINTTITSDFSTTNKICDVPGATITFTSSNTSAGMTHQWYYSASEFGFTAISGATNNTYSTTLPGYYYVIIKNGNCEAQSNTMRTCSIFVNYKSSIACQGSNIVVPIGFFRGPNQTATIQLVDASTNAVVNSNLLTFTTDGTNPTTKNVTIPASVAAGNYKFLLTTVNATYSSPVSAGILTISNQAAGAAPTITTSINTITASQAVTVTASGCIGNINWSNNASIFPIYTAASVNRTSVYSATCTDLNGCTSPSGTATVTYSCSDVLEPNDTQPTATPITSNTYISPTICLDGNTNDDWFSWAFNGQTYHFQVALNTIGFSTAGAGLYKFQLTLTGSSLVVETLPSVAGQILYTTISLYEPGNSQRYTSNSGGNGNGFSKITYTVNTCPSALNLVSPTHDIAAGQTSTMKGSTITATNKVVNTAVVDYRGQNTVTLNPGFETQINSGGTFKAQVKGCSDTSN
jgi:large repetitive protein